MPFPLAVLVSGSGSNLQSILDKIQAGAIDAEVRVVLSNKPGAYGLERARKLGIKAEAVPHAAFPTREAFDAELVRIINDHGICTGVGAVLLAGFMRMLTPEFLRAFPQQVLNIHPALLPSFPGTHGAADAAAYGVRLAGCSVHFVDEIMDHGPVVIQAAVPTFHTKDGLASSKTKAGESLKHTSDKDENEGGIEGGDALAARILRLEHCIYPQAVSWLAEGRLSIQGRHVQVAGASPASFGDAAQPYMTSPGLEPGFLPIPA